MARKSPKRHTGLIIFLVFVMVLSIAGSALMIKLCIDLADTQAPARPSQGPSLEVPTEAPTEEETVPETTLPVPEHVVSTATIVSTGDLLMHMPVINTCWVNGEYNFDSVFRYLGEYVSGADYAVANLETTLAGTENGFAYNGYPMFNCPDAIVDSALGAGFDMLLNANNHSYDTRSVGMHRTISVLKDRGMAYLGIVDNDEEPRYLIQEINGIKIGMIAYTYETDTNADTVALNGLPVKADDAPLVNCFDYNALGSFYSELAGHLDSMTAEGAEAIVLYIHWGEEYQLQQNANQDKIAQALCDLGVDVIIGGHPHVVQPMELLQSSNDPNHKTVCLYSMGNAVSNQRQGNLTAISSAHTEDGVLFSVTFSKYSDGTVYLESTDLIPLWVLRRSDATGNEYNMLPLDLAIEDQWQELFNMQDYHVTSAKNSYERTMAIVGTGLQECQAWLQQCYEDREAYYYDLAFFPEKYATEATEAPTEPATETTGETTAE